MEVQTDVNTNQAVTDSGVVQAPQPATEQNTDVSQVTAGNVEQAEGDVTQQAAAATAEQQVDKGPVPYDRFSAVNTEKNTLADENAQLREHIALLGNQQPVQQAQQVQQPQQPESLTLQVMKQMGIDQEYATPVEMAQVIDKVSEIRSSMVTQQNQQQNFMSAHADYSQVVGVTNQQGQFVAAPPLLRAFQADPNLQAALLAAGQGANLLAYKIAVNDPAYQQQLVAATPQGQAVAAETVVNNAQKLTSISALGNNGVIDKGAQLAAMSDEQFQEHKKSIIGQGGVSGY